MLISIIVVILAIGGIFAIRYNVEGEVSLPFNLSKISIISTVEGIDNTEDTENKWNLKVNQNNDIYLYFKKNDGYKSVGEDAIESVVLNNFVIEKSPVVGELKLFKPDANIENPMFTDNEENVVQEIKYDGSEDSSIKDLKIINQGGLLVFRYSVNGIDTYISNDDDEIQHSELLKKLNINNDDLSTSVSFDIYINLVSQKSFKSNIHLDLPVGNVVNDGVQSKEYTDFKDIIFKRI